MLRPEHNEMVAKILNDPEASRNDKAVALTMLLNADVAKNQKLPFCQDTGTAIVVAKKGRRVWVDKTADGSRISDEEALQHGVYDTYTTDNLRYSQTLPLDMYKEKNSGNNLPAQVDIYAPAQSRETRELPDREDEDPRYGGLPSLPHRIRNRRLIGRDQPQDRQARLRQVLRQPAHYR